tara:strand:- start:224 stop:544 length:321 start_codon:yes stop_codon:yes gene_type:complete
MSKILNKIEKQISLLNSNEINIVIQMIKNHRDKLSYQASTKLYAGQTVTFSGRGMTVKGVIRKINRKTAIVADPNYGKPKQWKVSINLLEPVKLAYNKNLINDMTG